jgi:hypothetical protein
VSVAAFVFTISWDGSAAVLVRTFWLGVATGLLTGPVLGSVRPWANRHRAGARTAAWWLGAGPIVLLGGLSIVSPWTYFLCLVLLFFLILGLILGLPVGLLAGGLVRRCARRRRERARWLHE